MRVFAGFELETMHRSDKGPKIDAPLFGSTSPFGHTGCWKSGLRGEGFAPFKSITIFFELSKLIKNSMRKSRKCVEKTRSCYNPLKPNIAREVDIAQKAKLKAKEECFAPF